MRALAPLAAASASAARRAFSSAAASSAAWWRAEPAAPCLPASRGGVPCSTTDASVSLAPGVGFAARRWMAVPKHKVSPSRRGIRNGRKHVARVQTLAKCSRCATIMHPWQVPHSFCDDAACPSRLASGGSAAPVAGVAPTEH